jgi:uncharacterized membrane protein YhaH (DUF805 family)
MNPQPKVPFCLSIRKGFQNYINFEGRCRRSEFWYFRLLIYPLTLLLLIIGFIIGWDSSDNDDLLYAYFLYFMPLYALGFILPLISSIVRRLHDIGKSGNYIFIAIVPIFGQISLLILLCLDSEKGQNKFGPSQKYVTSDTNSGTELLMNPNDINA